MLDTHHLGLPLPQRNVSRHGRVTAVSMMKDEGPYLLEWVAHQLCVGFTDLVVYTNDCTDGTDEMLIRLEALGLAHHRRNVIAPRVKPQPSAIRHAQEDPVVQGSDWVMVFDADEFLCIRLGDGTLDTLLDRVTAAGAQGIVVTWRIFGSGGIRDWSRAPVTEQYLMAAPPMWNKGWGVKTLFRFDPEAWRLGIHRPKLKNRVLDTDYPAKITWLNGSGREMEDYFKFRGWRSILRTVGYDWAQMNHYAVKSVDSYAIRRLRGNVNNKADKYDDAYWALQDRNEVRDETMLRYSQRRRALIDGLMSDPVLRRLHLAAMDGAEARLAELRPTEGYAHFVSGLEAAGQVPITRVEARPPKPRDAAAIAARMRDVEARGARPKAVDGGADPVPGPGPVDLLVCGPLDMSADPALDWHANHSVELPADPRLFTPPGLDQVAEGKFERNLARNFPRHLPAEGHFLDLGSGTGFLGTHLALTRPDLRVTLLDPDPARRTHLRRLWRHNGVAETPGRRLRDLPADDPGALARMLRDDPAVALALGDPALSPSWLGAALAAPQVRPAILLLTGRLWGRAFAALRDWEAALGALGYDRRLPFDPAAAAGFGRSEPAGDG